MSSDNTGDSKCWSIITAEGDEHNKFDHILKPLDVSISLTVSMLPHSDVVLQRPNFAVVLELLWIVDINLSVLFYCVLLNYVLSCR